TRQPYPIAAMTAETRGDFLSGFLSRAVHVRGNENLFKTGEPIELILNPFLLATFAATERNRHRVMPIGGPGQRINFALGKDDLTGIIRNSLPPEQHRFAIGGCWPRRGARLCLPHLSQRQNAIRQQEREDDIVALFPDLERIKD